jgi:hypothetical protein
MADVSRTSRIGCPLSRSFAKSNAFWPTATGFSFAPMTGHLASLTANSPPSRNRRPQCAAPSRRSTRGQRRRAETPPHRLRLRLHLRLKAGAKVDRLIVNIDTMRCAELVKRRQFYVSISDARNAISLYTDDRSRLDLAVAGDREKSIAPEHVLCRSTAPD